MKQENHSNVDLEKITEYELRIKSLEQEVEQLKAERATYEKAVEERRLVEERYKQSQVKFRTIFEQSKMGHKILATDLRIIEVNQAMIAMLGYTSKSDLLNRRILEFSHPDFTAHWDELRVALWEKRIPAFSLDTCLVKKDGTSFWCRVTSILFDDENNSLGFTIIEDISERKYLEEKAEKLHQAQEMMMYLVAHDLKNPIHIISTLGSIIRKHINKGEAEKGLHYLELLEQTCNRSNTIINDLILVGELENGTLSVEQFDILELANQIIEHLNSQAEEKEIKLTCSNDQYTFFANADREKIGRALENLVSNAIKFSMKGGEVKIAAEKQPNSFLLKVEDQGIGIPANLQHIVFNRFTKAGRKGTGGEETTGLGLFITKRIVELHNGKIWFESKQNEGSTFFIRIPLSSNEELA